MFPPVSTLLNFFVQLYTNHLIATTHGSLTTWLLFVNATIAYVQKASISIKERMGTPMHCKLSAN